jgi:choline monooxygenase
VVVNPDPDAAPREETLGELPELVARAGLDLELLRFHHRSHSAYEANWKVCCENFLECYHCQVAHPGFSRVVDVSRDAYVLDESRWFSSQFGPVKERPRGDFDPTGDVPRGQFHFLFPNVIINVMPGRANLSIGPVLPAGPERTERFLDYFFAAGEDEEWIAGMLEFDGQVGREDAVLVERVQRGLRSGLLDNGRLMADSERLIAHFGRLLVEQLGA